MSEKNIEIRDEVKISEDVKTNEKAPEKQTRKSRKKDIKELKAKLDELTEEYQKLSQRLAQIENTIVNEIIPRLKELNIGDVSLDDNKQEDIAEEEKYIDVNGITIKAVDKATGFSHNLVPSDKLIITDNLIYYLPHKLKDKYKYAKVLDKIENELEIISIDDKFVKVSSRKGNKSYPTKFRMFK